MTQTIPASRIWPALAASLLVVLLLASGCGGKDQPNDPDPDPIDSTDQRISDVRFTYVGGTGARAWSHDSVDIDTLSAHSPPKIKITAWRGGGREINEQMGEQLSLILKSSAVGTYGISHLADSAQTMFISDLDPSAVFDLESNQGLQGTLTITASTADYIAGTFEFSGISAFTSTPFEVKSGLFKVYYPE